MINDNPNYKVHFFLAGSSSKPIDPYNENDKRAYGTVRIRSDVYTSVTITLLHLPSN